MQRPLGKALLSPGPCSPDFCKGWHQSLLLRKGLPARQVCLDLLTSSHLHHPEAQFFLGSCSAGLQQLLFILIPFRYETHRPPDAGFT